MSLFPVKIARKKILQETVNKVNSPFLPVESLKVICKVFGQYGQMESTMLKLLNKKIVKPMAVYRLQPRFIDAVNFHVIIMQIYGYLTESNLFPLIVEATLTHTQIGYFFNLPVGDFVNNHS